VQTKASESAAQTYQANLDARHADKVGHVEDKGRRRLPICRDGPKARLKAVRRGQEERFKRIYERAHDRNGDHARDGLE
jgi:hypothetical protein